MNHCKTCKWYEPDKQKKDGPRGRCNHAKVDGWKLWEADTLGTDGVDCSVGVTMGPEFGCVHHEEKP